MIPKNEPTSELPALEKALQSRCWQTRLAAVKALQSLAQPEAVPPLCQALRDHEPRVRLAVAEALGELGDERAIAPLQEAVRAGLVGRSAWWHLGIGLLLMFAVTVLLIGATGIPTDSFDLKQHWWAAMLIGMGQISVGRILDLRGRGQVRRALIEALVRVGERHPTPELRRVMPDLRVIGSGLMQQDPSTRPVSEMAARRIRELTADLKDLPLPASGAPDEATLPRVGEAPAVEEITLPRVR